MSEENIPAEFFEKYPEPEIKSRLSRIWEQLGKDWGTQEGASYLESLLVVEDGRDREGFDFAVLTELLLLEKLHEEAYPEFIKPTWEKSFDFSGDSDSDSD